MADDILPVNDITAAMGGAPLLSAKIGVNTNIDKASQDFEAMFATQMLQPMFETVDVDPSFGGGHGEEVMRSFLLQEYGKIMAKTGRLGIASQVKTEMLKAQEAAASRNTGASTRSAQNSYINAVSQGEANVSIQ